MDGIALPPPVLVTPFFRFCAPFDFLLNLKNLSCLFKVIGGGVKDFFGQISRFNISDRADHYLSVTFYGIEKNRSAVEIRRFACRENGGFP